MRKLIDFLLICSVMLFIDFGIGIHLKLYGDFLYYLVCLPVNILLGLGLFCIQDVLTTNERVPTIKNDLLATIKLYKLNRAVLVFTCQYDFLNKEGNYSVEIQDNSQVIYQANLTVEQWSSLFWPLHFRQDKFWVVEENKIAESGLLRYWVSPYKIKSLKKYLKENK